MPVRKKANRRRTGEVEAWAGYFQSGCDFFDELAAVGVDEESAETLAEATWRRIGLDVIAHIDELHRGFYPPPRPFWAEEQFGSPSAKRRR